MGVAIENIGTVKDWKMDKEYYGLMFIGYIPIAGDWRIMILCSITGGMQHAGNEKAKTYKIDLQYGDTFITPCPSEIGAQWEQRERANDRIVKLVDWVNEIEAE